MLRTFVALLSFGFLAGLATADDKPVKNQMVKGTIKSVNLKDSILVVNQKVKSETIERQLDIKDATEFVISIGGEKTEASGKEGLALLEGKEGAEVTVKCDKDVSVLKVTAKVKK